MTTATPAESSSPSSRTNNGDPDLTTEEVVVYIVLPLVIAVFLAIIALLLLLVYLVMRSRAKQRERKYTKIPCREESILKNLSDLPFPSLKGPPTIKLTDPPSPSLSSGITPQLPSSPPSHRYPFFKHKRQENKTIHGDDKRPQLIDKQPRKSEGETLTAIGKRKRGKRRLRKMFSEAKTSDSSATEGSPRTSPEPTGRRRGKTELKPTVSNPGLLTSVEAAMETFTLSAARKMLARSPSSVGKPPEVFLSLSYEKEKTTLVVTVQRVVGLPPREDETDVDAYVRLFFKPRCPEFSQRRTSKTRTQRSEQNPVFEEVIHYEAMSEEELINSTLQVQVLDYRSYGRHPILGQSEISLMEIPLGESDELVVLQLYPPRASVSLGTLLLSMSYSTVTKKLSIILLRAKDLNRGNSKETDAQAKIQVIVEDKSVARLKSRKKPESSSPIFNEALTCVVERDQIQKVKVQISLTNEHKSAPSRELGNVVLSSKSSGEEYRHWNDVLAQPGKHIAEWHELRPR